MFRRKWARFWMRKSGLTVPGQIATYFAALFTPPYYSRVSLARLHPKGYISPKATIFHDDLRLGKYCYIDEHVLIYRDRGGEQVELCDSVHIHRDTIIQTGSGGQVLIGVETHIQPRCQISAYKSSVRIGERVEIAPNCAFYPYDHAFDAGKRIRELPLKSRGGIIIEDDVWLGFGVIVLDGVRIGKGAVVGAGAVVSRNIAENSIAVGNPVRVVKMRTDQENQI